MSLRTISDGALAVHARRGDSTAFAELARRYRPLIHATIRQPTFGVRTEDQRQEALIGLYRACCEYRHGAFRGYAKIAVRRQVLQAFQAAAARKHRLLTDALHLEQREPGDDQGPVLADTIPGPAGNDPAVVVPLRMQLLELASSPNSRAAARAVTAPGAKRKRFTHQQITTALTLLAEGQSLREAGAAVNATGVTVAYWRDRAGVRPQRTRNTYTREQIKTALALVDGGQTLRAAGAAVGASDTAVARWRARAAA